MRIASQKLLAAFRTACARTPLVLFCAVLSMMLLPIGWLPFSMTRRATGADTAVEGVSSRAARKEAVQLIPFPRISASIAKQLGDVVDHPSFYRRMPTQEVECDGQMFTFLVRRPEVMVNIWEIMGITKVSARRVNPTAFLANDGVGTQCKCDLVYSGRDLHIYYGAGTYDGSMAPKEVTGRCVCILRSVQGRDSAGKPIVRGTMDVFLKLDSIGADLLARSVGPFVGKTADYNFAETAKFISQISQVCEQSPHAAQALASRLERVDGNVRNEFATIAARLGRAEEMRLTEQAYTAARQESQQLADSGSSQIAPIQRAADPVLSPLYNTSGLSPSQPPSMHLSDSRSDDPPVTSSRVSNWTQSESSSESHSERVPGELGESRPAAILPRKQNIYMRR